MKKIFKNKGTMAAGAIIWTLAVLALFSSCDSFVDVEQPSNQLTGVTVFQDKTTADAAMRNVYASIRDNGMLSGAGFGISAHLGLYTDELDFYGAPEETAQDFYDNSVLALNGAVSTYWNTAYSQIYAANAVYEGVSQSTGIAAVDGDRLKGEALFVRALLHLYLAGMYGDIPYVATTDYTVNSHVSRMPLTEVYDRITADLETAATLLPEEYNSSGRARPNRAAAFALLSRAYLYAGLYAEASNAASAVLNQTELYADETDLDKVFLKDCTETIWQLPPAPEGMNALEGATFTVLAAPPNFVALTPDLATAFSAGDLRATHWMGSVTDGGTTYFYPTKYKQYEPGSESTEYSIVLRTAEVYLIRAEARARQGELSNAAEDLNHVRAGAGLSPLNGLDQQQLLDAILRERRLELFTEFGHRFFDLKRLGNIDATLSGLKSGWNTTDKLLPLPQAELSANPNLLPQNPGY